MPLQNRVTPFGEIIAHPARGTFMGNRGGRIHDIVSRTLTKRRWASRQWIICRLGFKNRQRQVMGDSYTELFFLDEVTALAAGHRPCFECRRDAANAYFAAHDAFYAEHDLLPQTGRRLRAVEMDTLLHLERTGQTKTFELDVNELPDGTVFADGDEAWALNDGQLLHWTPDGYDESVPVSEKPRLTPLTPMTTIGILAHGYQPVWHATAGTF